ncbi:uncharacterized protein LOC131318377 [Rhododendron vialii]|uniref:uncharacterized protein LOC131318377 n=1 Tax=Rhododendron vialii TaxID=182163 RepID=UPI0026604D8C|nr:uncharacterized protein LOC131318377 [Rhododendron vialii]XP_058204063.1 uncharacterized protein LOC131318377 [Rhododendron vialii]XP_058204064.1 uncharacterized protein LOC131318377 [Rhododendron vialii]XP_058204065.1 uncharacterized protein LOC131318377 [Rhododendron vialii]XP_058204066.1 uncharacterized protein LOC131318377 [Rhododendron vialii]XP_058204067.1 uncharacterized protein LOC131318377 [Rhododendron vialii]
MTSNVVDYMFDQWGCRCWSQNAPMKDKFCHDSPYPEHRCAYLSLLTEAKKYVKPELFEKLDEVMVFEALSYEQNRAVGRLQPRDIASSIAGRRLILYPSETALCEIVVRESVWPYKLLNAVDDLISNAVDALFVLNECILETSNCSNEETKPLEKERSSKRPMNQVQGLCMLLANRMVGQNQAIDVVGL